MLKAVVFPPLDGFAAVIRVAAVHAAPGARLSAGAALADFEVEFDPGASYQCPPVSHFRLLLREPGWLSRFDLAVGDVVAPEARLAVLSPSPDETPLEVPVQDARVTLASILPPQDSWWSDSV